jgi:Tol biopolymer transport system component
MSRLKMLLGGSTAGALAILSALTLAPAEAAFPGLNGRIACQGQRGPALPSPNPDRISRNEIFTVNPDGTDERVISDNQLSELDPAYSPDGTKIAFSGRLEDPTTADIYVADNDGDLVGPDVRRLTFSAQDERSPSWSPDGTQLVFHSNRPAAFDDGGTTPANDFEIYKISATNGERPEDGGFVTRLTNSRRQDAIPAWSPDGTKISFQSLRESTPERSQNLEIFTMNPDGSDVTNISNSPGSLNDPGTTANENSNGIDSFGTAWSPDSSQLAFGSTRDTAVPGNQNFEVYKMNRDGSNPTRLTLNLSGDTPAPEPFQDYDQAPTWSPDGRRILFHSGRTSTADGDEFVVYTMDAQAGEAAGLQRVATTGDAPFFRCDWQALAVPASPPPPPPAPPAGPGPAREFEGCPPVSAARNVLALSSGNDTRNGTPGDDLIFAGTGSDVIDALAGDDCVDLGPGADRGQGGPGDDLVVGGQGDDRSSGSSGNDRMRGDGGDDRLVGGRGNDSLFGQIGDDELLGGLGNDLMVGQAGNDRMVGSRGRDRLNGGRGNDRLFGESSPDRINSGSGKDRVRGGSGNDVVRGDSGNDRLIGDTGRDRIFGGLGNDVILAVDGQRDRIRCGVGVDRVVADRVDRVDRASCERVRRVRRG